MNSRRKTLAAAATLAAVLGATSPSFAHNPFEVDVAAGYRLPGGAEMTLRDVEDTELAKGRFKADGSLVLSGTVGYRIQPDGFIYLTYSRSQTTFHFDAEGSTALDFSGDGAVEYYQFGGNVEKTVGILVPYLGFSLGLGRISASGGGSSRIFFAPVLDGGMKFDLHEHFHLRVLGRLPILFTQRDVFCPTDTCVYANEIKPFAQLELLGGLGVSF